MPGEPTANQTQAPAPATRPDRELARQVVESARRHRAAKQAGPAPQEAQALEQSLRDAAAPMRDGSPEFVRALQQSWQEAAERPELMLRASLSELRVGPGPVWHNWAGDQTVRPRVIETPASLEQLVELVRGATERGERVRCVGPGHSYSDITETTGVLIDVTSMKERTWFGNYPAGGLLPLERELWKDPASTEPRVRVACGGRITELNAALHSAGLAFGNLGGHVGQTVLGALATSTHGSGWELPPLCDILESLTLVTTGGQVLCVEPKHGLTDPEKFARRWGGSRRLEQDDRLFDALLVSLGCMGIVYAATLKVQPAFLLRETRVRSTWTEVKARIAAGVAQSVRHYQVLVNPYLRNGDHECVEIDRQPELPGSPLHPRSLAADFTVWLAATGIAEDLALFLIHLGGSKMVEWLVHSATSSQVWNQPVVDQSYRVFDNGYSSNITPVDGVSQRIKAVSTELCFPVEKTVAAMERVLQLVRDNEGEGLLQGSPLGLRFVAPSRASASMMSRGRTATIELPILKGTPKTAETLLSYEQTLCHGPDGEVLQGTPHWGQTQTLTGDPAWLKSRYPRWEEWLSVFRELNSKGIFDNHFTDRLGISVGRPA